MEAPSFTLILPAAGVGRRMRSKTPKPYLMLKGKSVLEHTLTCFRELDSLKQVIISTNVAFHDQTSEILDRLFDNVDTKIVEGGERRQDSIYNAFQKVSDSIDYVAVHDAVRPFIKAARITECLHTAAETGAAIIGVPVKDTIKRVDGKNIIKDTPDRSKLWQAQTPQIFRKEMYDDAYRYAGKHDVEVTDDASLFEAAGMKVRIVEGDRENLKLTYPVDFRIAEMLVDSFEP